MINLDSEDYDELLNILKARLEKCDVFVFGSRACKKSKKFSDVDICIKGEGIIPFDVISDLEEALSESSLPVSVDVIDYHSLSPEFKNVIDRTYKIHILKIE